MRLNGRCGGDSATGVVHLDRCCLVCQSCRTRSGWAGETRRRLDGGSPVVVAETGLIGGPSGYFARCRRHVRTSRATAS